MWNYSGSRKGLSQLVSHRGAISMTSTKLGITLVLTAMAAWAPLLHGQVTFTTVALSGQPAPTGDGDLSFSLIYPGAINASGQVAFMSRLRGPDVVPSKDQSLWVGVPGSLALVAREEFPAPGTSTNFGLRSPLWSYFFNSFVFTDSGAVAFWAPLLSGPSDAGIWFGPPGALNAVALTGDTAPGTADGVKFAFLGRPAANASGQVAFTARLAGTGVTSANDQGLWIGVPGSLSLVTRSGSRAPDTSDDQVYSDFFVDTTIPSLNAAGQLAFRAGLRGPGVDASNDEGIWFGGPGTLRLVAREGSRGFGSSDDPIYQSLSAPVLSDVGQLAFRCTLRGTGVNSANDTAYCVGTPGSPVLQVREGTHAPGTPDGVYFGDLTALSDAAPSLSASGQIAFRAKLTGAGVDAANDEGIWASRAGSLSLLARSGSHAPDTAAAVNFASDFNNPVLSPSGQVAFVGSLTGPDVGPENENNSGLCATDPDGDPLLVARRGGLLDLGGGDLRSIHSAAGTSFNAASQFAVGVQFADGSHGVVVATVGTVRPRITAVERVGAGIQIEFTTVAGKHYAVEFTADLLEGGWAALPNSVAGTGSVVSVLDKVAVTQPARFYRVRVL